METFYDITDDAKRDVLAATDLVTLVGASTSLKKMGNSWKGLCPFHGEKTPSFYVHPTKGFYYCFGCGAKGDAITFVRETERLEFPEAVAYLARLAGVTLPVRKGAGTRADRGKETRVSEAIGMAARFFRDELSRHAGARRLLEKRGLSIDDAAAYGFGAAPEGWDALKSALSGFPEELLVESGLMSKNPETGRVYDRFRNRLTVEVRDARGEVLGFGARALGEEQPKYLNSPESARFSKGKLLYGLDRAREAIRQSNLAVLCEGYFDRIAFERAGVPNAVASMGTALTPAQADLIARHAPTVVVAYDGDPAGQAATLKAFALLVSRGVAVKHLVFPEEHDPDSLLLALGPEALRQALESALPVVDSLARGIPAQGGDPTERAHRLTEAVQILTGAPERLVRYELLSGLSRATGVPLPVLTGTEGKKPREKSVDSTEGTASERLPESEETVLSVLLSEWPASAPLVARIPAEVFSHPTAREIFGAVKALDANVPTLDFSGLQSHVGDGAGLIVARLLLLQEAGKAAGNIGTAETTGLTDGSHGLGRLHKPLMQLKIRQLEERGTALSREIDAAEKAGDADRQRQLSGDKQTLIAAVRRLKSDFKKRS